MKQFSTALFILALGLGLLALPAHAQSGAAKGELVVLNTFVEEDESGARLKVTFTLRDRDGQPLLGDDLQVANEGRLALGAASATAVVGPPEDPIKIALVIDASGSMNLRDADGAPLIGQVRAAAAQMIDAAPENAEFAVYSFADKLERQYAGFRRRDQADQIKDAIANFKLTPSEQGDTCLYDAASRVIDDLVAAQPGPAEQLAVVLFTDGKDRENGGELCGSTIRAPELVRKARGLRAEPIPLYTIAVCTAAGADPCENINRVDLTNLAQQTGAFPAIGPREELGALFTRLMQELSSQWVAEATLCPPKGEHTALLTITQGGAKRDVAVPFTATRACFVPPSFAITHQAYLAATDSYSVTLEITSPERVGMVMVAVHDSAEGGLESGATLAFDGPPAQLAFMLPSTDLVAGHDYYLRVTAVDTEGRPLTGPKGALAVAVNKFTYSPTLDLTVLSVEPDWDAEQLVVGIKLGGAGGRTFTIGGSLRDAETGQSEALPAVAPEDGRLRLAMPPMLREAHEARSYILTLALEAGGQSLTPSFTRVLPLRPDPTGAGAPGWLIAAGLAALAGGVVGVLVLARRKSGPPIIEKPYGDATVLRPTAQQGGTAALAVATPRPAQPTARTAPGATERHRPPAEATKVHAAPAPRSARRLRLKVLQTPAPGLTREQTVSSFPLTVGRVQGQLSFPDDTKMSGRHIEITLRDGAFSLIDQHATNGTWVGERRLGPGERVLFTEQIVVRLGPNTTIELAPESS